MADGVEFLADIPGASNLLAWFGFWPTFHDGEVLSVHLNRSDQSHLRVRTWERTNQVDVGGYYIQQKHVTVTFILEDIRKMELTGFSCQNVISDLTLKKDSNGYRLDLGPCYGIGGTITAGSVRIQIEPFIQD